MASLPKAAFLPVALVTAAVSIAALTATVSSGDDGTAVRVSARRPRTGPRSRRPAPTPTCAAFHSSMTGTVVVEP